MILLWSQTFVVKNAVSLFVLNLVEIIRTSLSIILKALYELGVPIFEINLMTGAYRIAKWEVLVDYRSS